MKVVFAGTPDFAAQSLQAIKAAGHDVVLVLTQPDRNSGRGMRLHASPVKEWALHYGIAVLQPETLKRNNPDIIKRAQAEEVYQTLASIDFDVMVVVAYGLILPQDFLDISEQNGRHGCLNIHASLLPRWRGAAPIQRAIEAGDIETGVTVMKMDAGLDTGGMVLRKSVDIAPDETSSTLHDKLAIVGAELIIQCLHSIAQNPDFFKETQPIEGVTYAQKILKSEASINWLMSAQAIDNKIRALNPFPGASSRIGNDFLKLWRSRQLSEAEQAKWETMKLGRPGAVLGYGIEGVVVECAEGVLEVLEVQKPGGRNIASRIWLEAEQNSPGLSPIIFQ